MGLKPFRFKQFTVKQNKCAMKVGTDGVLLGAWTSLDHNPKTILDIGTGTGLIALQLAQRSNNSIIEAIEIDESAYIQATENFVNSPWADILFCHHQTLEKFYANTRKKYDLIVSNPPFNNENILPNDEARILARSNTSLSFAKLISITSKLLSPKGTFSIIIPFKEEAYFLAVAKKYDLYINRICRVKGSTTSKIKRSLLEFSFIENELITSTLILENKRNDYTNAYKELVRAFYLHL